MKILLLGKTGLLGQALFSAFQDKHSVHAPSHAECDILNEKSLVSYLNEYPPDIIVNATGYIDVDKAEDEKEKAFSINSLEKLIAVIEHKGIPLMHFSTDYVFDGKKREGYIESNIPAPLSVYGASKAAGEENIKKRLKKYYIIRTAWLYGPGGKNFVDTILGLADEKKPIRIVNDQRGNPTYTLDLAKAVLALLESQKYGIYHIVNTRDATWYEFAAEIVRQLGIPQQIIPISSNELGRKAKRPAYSMLRSTKFPGLRHWKKALAEYLMEKTIIL